MGSYNIFPNTKSEVDKIPGLVLIGGILLLSAVFPNNRRRIGEYERVND